MDLHQVERPPCPRLHHDITRLRAPLLYAFGDRCVLLGQTTLMLAPLLRTNYRTSAALSTSAAWSPESFCRQLSVPRLNREPIGGTEA